MSASFYEHDTDDSLEITCMICADLVVDAQRTNCCQRLFCLSCMKTWLNKNKNNSTNSCPNCRVYISEANLVFDAVVDEISAAKIRPCPNKELFSCMYTGNRTQIEAHKEDCLTNYQISALSGVFDLLRDGSDAEKADAAMRINESLKVNPKLAKYIIDQNGINLLISLLESKNEEESPYWAIMCFDLLAMDEATKQVCIDSGILQPLLHLISTASDYIIPNSMMLLSKFVISNRINQDLFASAGAAELLVRHLQSSSAEVQINAAGAIWNLVSKNRKNQIEVASLGAFPHLIAMLLSGNNIINAAGALWNIIATSDPTVSMVVNDIEVANHLVKALQEGNIECREWIVGCFETLCSSNAGNIEIIAAAGAMPHLAANIRAARGGSSILTLLSASVMLCILKHNAQYRAELKEREVLVGLLRTLQEPSPRHPRTVAFEVNVMQLLRILCNKHEENQAYIVSSGGIVSLLWVLSRCTPYDAREGPVADLLAHISAMSSAAALVIAETHFSLSPLVQVLGNSASRAETKIRALEALSAAYQASPHAVTATMMRKNRVSGIDILVKLLLRLYLCEIPDEVVASVAQLLRALCEGNEECRRAIQTAGVVSSSSFGYTGEGAW